MIPSEMQKIVNEVCEAMKTRTAPWQKPWTNETIPRNAVTGHAYTGMNAIVLGLKGSKQKIKDPRWMTYKQAQSQGWYVKKGSKGTRAILCIPSVSGSQIELTFSRYVLFHASQVEGIPPYVPKIYSEIEKNSEAERIIKSSGAIIQYGGNRAYYHYVHDRIHVPYIRDFIDQTYYYATMFHELAHWTGHKRRLNRNFSGQFGSDAYAFEELVAEITSMFISGETGIPQTKEHFDNHTVYIISWLDVFHRDVKALFKAANLAQKASDYILKHKHEHQ